MHIRANRFHRKLRAKLGGQVLRAGCVVITLWAVLNMIPSLFILLNTTFRDGNSPAIYQILSDSEIGELTPNIRASINSVAIYANGLNVALCLLALFTIWFGLCRGFRWAFWGLAAGLSTAVFGGAAADYILGTVHPEVSLGSAMILVIGFALAAFGLFRNSEHSNHVPS